MYFKYTLIVEIKCKIESYYSYSIDKLIEYAKANRIVDTLSECFNERYLAFWQIEFIEN